MTTTVKIRAHVEAHKEVSVVVIDEDAIVEHLTLQDGETAERFVYGGREINIKEIDKS